MQYSMIPIVLHSPSQADTDAFVDEFIKKHGIKPHFVTHVAPETKEFSIKQVRELIKQTVYAQSEIQLFVLYKFDSASLEAQNALLKTLEEHKAADQFILEAAQPQRLLPTILSRSRIVAVGKRRTPAQTKNAELEKAFASQVPPLNNVVFQAQSYENPLEPFDHLISFFKEQLPKQPNASAILKEVIISRNRVRENNLNAQYALDRVLIMIYKNR